MPAWVGGTGKHVLLETDYTCSVQFGDLHMDMGVAFPQAILVGAVQIYKKNPFRIHK